MKDYTPIWLQRYAKFSRLSSCFLLDCDLVIFPRKCIPSVKHSIPSYVLRGKMDVPIASLRESQTRVDALVRLRLHAICHSLLLKRAELASNSTNSISQIHFRMLYKNIASAPSFAGLSMQRLPIAMAMSCSCSRPAVVAQLGVFETTVLVDLRHRADPRGVREAPQHMPDGISSVSNLLFSHATLKEAVCISDCLLLTPAWC